MSIRQRVASEMKTVGLVTLYFVICFGVMITLKRLWLAEYEIEFRGLWMAIVGALIVAKVVVVLEHVPLGRWTRRRPAALDVALRTLLYTLGVFVAVLLERAFDARHEAGGFGRGVAWVFEHRDIHHVWATTIGVTVALLLFNVHAVLQQLLGEEKLSRLFFALPLAEVRAKRWDQGPIVSAGARATESRP